MSDQITAIVLTSPVPSNPDTDMIEQTVRSIFERLPFSPLFIACDGVRIEQLESRWPEYEMFRNRLITLEYARMDWFDEHHHQSGMMRELLPEVETPYLLFVEHDTPLDGDIPFDQIIPAMEAHQINSVRFMHETHVLEEHEYLYDDTVELDGIRLRKTRQFSARPHLARTDWYRHLITDYFTEDSRCFIEDKLHSPAQAPGADFRLAIYAPEGNMKRSLHLDGRAGDPKYPQFFGDPSYDNKQ